MKLLNIKKKKIIHDPATLAADSDRNHEILNYKSQALSYFTESHVEFFLK